MKAITVLLIVILAVGSAFGVRVIMQLQELESRMENPASHSGVTASPRAQPETPNETDLSEAAPAPLELRSIEEAVAILTPHLKKKGIEELARDCALVDTWMFPAEDEGKGGDLIEKFIELLRRRIVEKVEELDKQALAAQTGDAADALYAKASALVQLYPVPPTADAQQVFENNLRRHSEVSRRIQEMRHLRYNSWAISQIEKGFKMFHENLRTFNDSEEDVNLVRTTASALRRIDSDLLTPSVMELYMGLLRQTYEQISEEHRSDLAKSLNDPEVAKKTLSEF